MSWCKVTPDKSLEVGPLPEDDSGRTYTVYVVVVDKETKQTVDLYQGEVADMHNLEQARLVAKIMAGQA